jgi:hypothetical protein
MFMRHFGYGVGHLQNERQPEIEPEVDISMGRTFDNVADAADSSDDLDIGDSDPDEQEVVVAVDSDEEEAEYGKDVRVDEEDTSDNTISDPDSDRNDCNSDGYASY